MAIPDYADERSYNRFRRGFAGTSHGDDKSGYCTDWNSQCDAKPTKMISTFYRPVCAYCGNMGLPLQPNIERYKDYDVIGYTCVCKGAMDEEAWSQDLVKIEKRHIEELRDLHKCKPRTNPNVIKDLVKGLTEKLSNLTDIQEIRRILQQIKDISEE